MRRQNSILVLVFLLGLVVSSSAAQRSIEGHWEGVMVREGAELPVSFDFTSAAKGLTASFNSPTQKAMGIPLRNVSYTAPNVHFELVGDATTNVFDGELTGDTIAGQFREGDARGTFSIRRVDAKPPTFKQEEVSFRNGDVTLSGTLLLPLTEAPHPAVVFLHGAGSEGRYGARFLAECLQRLGRKATIVVATSGDTGAAVGAAFHGRPGFGVVILYPDGRVSPRQAHQLGAFGGNVRAFRVAGTFDDCQRMVKETLAARPDTTSANLTLEP